MCELPLIASGITSSCGASSLEIPAHPVCASVPYTKNGRQMNHYFLFCDCKFLLGVLLFYHCHFGILLCQTSEVYCLQKTVTRRPSTTVSQVNILPRFDQSSSGVNSRFQCRELFPRLVGNGKRGGVYYALTFLGTSRTPFKNEHLSAVSPEQLADRRAFRVFLERPEFRARFQCLRSEGSQRIAAMERQSA